MLQDQEAWSIAASLDFGELLGFRSLYIQCCPAFDAHLSTTDTLSKSHKSFYSILKIHSGRIRENDSKRFNTFEDKKYFRLSDTQTVPKFPSNITMMAPSLLEIMASPSRKPLHLQPLTTNFHNKSLSSITSDAATFHSAQGNSSQMELWPISSSTSRTVTGPVQPSKPLASPKLQSLKMDRQDSGYEDSNGSIISSRRTSSSSNRRRSPSKPKRRTTVSTNSSRPSTKRAARSTPSAIRHSISSGQRPSLHVRHTAPYQSSHAPSYQFFHFPTLCDQTEPNNVTPAAPPPATVQYWTSDSTRRLEYAAIDAASQGMRGFFIKLLPDCVLPPSSRRTRFHEADADSDAGSVRRYRLALPEEKSNGGEGACPERKSRPGLWRRMTTFGRRSRSC